MYVHVCWGHKYQMVITHKIYSLRGSFPKLTNSLSPKMYSCLIKNEKNYTRQTALYFCIFGNYEHLRFMTPTVVNVNIRTID